jgi:hypothetical protein
MAEKEERPYFKSSISQLETLFEQLKANPESLKVLDHELSFRATNRAAKLRSRVAEVMAAVSFKRVKAVGADGGTPSTDHTAPVVPLPETLGCRTTLTREQSKPLTSTPVW